MSTTTSREVAFGYATSRPHSTVLEINMGMVDRGADIGWLSQYPHEEEILFGPLTGVEVQGTRVEGHTILVEAAPSVNTQPCASHTPSATTTQPNAPHAQSAKSRTHAQHQPQRGLSARGHPNLRWVAPNTQRRSPSASQTQSAPSASPTQSATTTKPSAPPAQSAETQPWANPEQFRGAHSAELAVIPVHQQQITEQSGEAQNRLIRRQHRHKCGDGSGRVRQTWPGQGDANGVRRRRWCCLHLHDAATGDASRKARTSS